MLTQEGDDVSGPEEPHSILKKQQRSGGNVTHDIDRQGSGFSVIQLEERLQQRNKKRTKAATPNGSAIINTSESCNLRTKL